MLISLGCLALPAFAPAGDDLYDTGNTYERVEREMERSTGRVEDQATYEIDRIERLTQDQSPVEGLEQDRDREERMENNARRMELQRRLDELTSVQSHETRNTRLPILFDTGILRWMTEVSILLAAPTTQPADR
jgi:hypothetical protein